MLFDHELFLYNFSQRFYEKAKLSGGLPIFYSLISPISKFKKTLNLTFHMIATHLMVWPFLVENGFM